VLAAHEQGSTIGGSCLLHMSRAARFLRKSIETSKPIKKLKIEGSLKYHGFIIHSLIKKHFLEVGWRGVQDDGQKRNRNMTTKIRRKNKQPHRLAPD